MAAETAAKSHWTLGGGQGVLFPGPSRAYSEEAPDYKINPKGIPRSEMALARVTTLATTKELVVVAVIISKTQKHKSGTTVKSSVLLKRKLCLLVHEIPLMVMKVTWNHNLGDRRRCVLKKEACLIRRELRNLHPPALLHFIL